MTAEDWIKAVLTKHRRPARLFWKQYGTARRWEGGPIASAALWREMLADRGRKGFEKTKGVKKAD